MKGTVLENSVNTETISINKNQCSVASCVFHCPNFFNCVQNDVTSVLFCLTTFHTKNNCILLFITPKMLLNMFVRLPLYCVYTWFLELISTFLSFYIFL